MSHDTVRPTTRRRNRSNDATTNNDHNERGEDARREHLEKVVVVACFIMSLALLLSRNVFRSAVKLNHAPMPIQKRGMGHLVRVIIKEDLPEGKAYEGDVMEVKAGYARNFLIPQKKALYATRKNFERLGLKDPDQETAEERQARLLREAQAGSDLDLKAYDLLRSYLRNKVVRTQNALPNGCSDVI
jgi:hypothetical protein